MTNKLTLKHVFLSVDLVKLCAQKCNSLLKLIEPSDLFITKSRILFDL
ncbi:hypothetical protein Mcup_0984 [Metallosphaera cuprina Ar-4]|uniref:Uncharacterized protein n=1 Tax=Metallosphaera cuprina (strain Ar-4) TaxID=1006006 RepID=F4G2P1_METCR|nr:hypothetical protein Mcup_0984 [Metallosphaera cuprina Ar-4]